MKILRVFIKCFAGALFCHSFVGAIFAVGWVYRLSQRGVFKDWWQQSRQSQSEQSFEQAMLKDPGLEAYAQLPNWFVEQNFSLNYQRRKAQKNTFFAKIAYLLKGISASFWLNGRIGLQAILNTWVISLPAMFLWYFAWQAGWDNSFYKGYEHAFIWTGFGFFGVFLFMATMLYLPLAQIRHAVTGQWRSFYQFRMIRKLIRRHWFSSVLLAGAYAGLGMPLMISIAAPTFIGNSAPFWNLTMAEWLTFAEKYYFWICVYGFLSFTALRLLAAKLYVWSALPGGDDAWQAMAQENDYLQKLAYHPKPDFEGQPHWIKRIIGWVTGRLVRTTVMAVTLLLWFGLVAQIFVGQFFNFHGARVWLNQPLIQMPCFNYMPKALQQLKDDS